MDLSQLDDKDIQAISEGRMQDVSQAGLNILAGKEEPGLASKALDVGLRGLDYLGGITRTALASPSGEVTKADLMSALEGKAPSSAEYLERMGLESGGSLSDILPSLYSETGEGLQLQKGGMLDPTARGTAGFAMDVAADPLTYLTFGASAVGKMGKVGKGVETALKPLSKTAEKGGKSMYKSGLKRIDFEASKYGKEPVSDLLMERGIAGGAGKIQKEMDILGDTLLKERNDILDAATKAGGTVDMDRAMRNTVERIAEIRASKDPMLQPIADALENQIKSYSALKEAPEKLITQQVPTGKTMFISPTKEVPLMETISHKIPAQPPVTPTQASGFKTSLYQSMPKSAYAEAVQTPTGKQIQKEMARGLKESTEESVGRTLGTDAQKALEKTNADLGKILTTKEKQTAEAWKEANKNLVTSVDVPLGMVNPWLLAGKKIADVAKMTGTRTYLGRAGHNLGKSKVRGPAMDILARRSIYDWLKPEGE